MRSRLADLRKLVDGSPDGLFSLKEAVEAGFGPSLVYKMVQSGELVRCGRGLYGIASQLEDDFSRLQRKYPRGIYSHETALYLLGYSDRMPLRFTMTFPKGYNAPSLKQELVNVKRAVLEKYDLGIREVQSLSQATVRVYDLERTLCDIVRGEGCDIQIVVPAMQRYAASRDKDVARLMFYAAKLSVEPKVRRYMEALL